MMMSSCCTANAEKGKEQNQKRDTRNMEIIAVFFFTNYLKKHLKVFAKHKAKASNE
jgi:hypothetical protein